ncbi:SACE_7040 family transcriptional regulator [Mycolicibacterium fortuitum]|jgi:AcrR family transcriptional regulator|uniref:TetR family transcriptional regulator n=3 Tax=Mycolicibacterium fortuitum TaxID=1766 RepID=A0A378UT29_MYCFO|nr:TetR/AcrR family transcriptional regulator [Mycolicibacterium fortuitum]AIY47494.1 Transcriptional regulator, TetR family [Mycobacterium sp. VKM Ac-1817D]CRL82360.1 TetR family transcriptional regulator [Mycolicibacter nonchromogenicus]AMD55330.1 TetR family transcriptional regulator [Mycolicibacterium fortuitum subsp. fortuitum DSM 46621 = ATCC 6841 = JCM 6387]EJZ14320.1 TetR family transcriptional regulator [Mycolicibacterium fortuitum subsp. fortuitum DSM 46621 = ATCC 6841 = JCM 6387]MCV
MSDSAVTRRSKAKSDRRSQLIAAAERLIAERGYLAVRLEDICSAVGISGPAIYRHFPNKEALLVELLVGISTRLLAGAQRVTAATEDPAESLNGLVDFHLDFVFGEPDLIRIQDRDLAHLPDAARRQVRRSQRQYVEIWVAVLTQLTPDLAEEDARVMAHAVFGLLNSTPYSARPAVPKTHSRALLRRMTLAALTAS